MGDVSSRRGMIEGQEERGNAIVVQASIPLSEMFGYATDLRSFTKDVETTQWYLIVMNQYLKVLEKKLSKRTVVINSH